MKRSGREMGCFHAPSTSFAERQIIIMERKYSAFDYLCNIPFYYKGIGYIKSPTLREIRGVTYDCFTVYVNTLMITMESCLKIPEFKEKYDLLDSTEKEALTLYNILLRNDAQLLLEIISFFITDIVEFNEDTNQFDIYAKQDIRNPLTNENTVVGHIGEDNYEFFRTETLKILGQKEVHKAAPPKYASETARLVAEMIEEGRKRASQAKKTYKNFELAI